MVMGKKSNRAADGGARCRRHRRQGAAGVCPLCLRERLSRLSLSTSLPSVVVARAEEAAAAAAAAASASCSDSDASSTEASSGASSGSASPRFHREMRRAARPSLLMRHERVVAVDGDGVVRRRKKESSTSFWTKLLRAATGGGGGKKDGCSVAHSKTVETSTATKWIMF